MRDAKQFLYICNVNVWLKGDDGSSEEPQQGILVKETESLYSLWCTGRVGCDGMLVEIKVSMTSLSNKSLPYPLSQFSAYPLSGWWMSAGGCQLLVRVNRIEDWVWLYKSVGKLCDRWESGVQIKWLN